MNTAGETRIQGKTLSNRSIRQDRHRCICKVIRSVTGTGIEQPGIDMVTEIPPPAGRLCRVSTFKIIRLHHLYLYQNQVVRRMLPDVIKNQVIDLLRIGDNKRLPGYVQKEFLPFAEKFHADGKFPVK